MLRVLIGAFVLVITGMVAAQPPVDYTVWCGDAEDAVGVASLIDGENAVEIGVASLINGEWHVAIRDDAMCDTMLVGYYDSPPFELTLDDDGTWVVDLDDVVIASLVMVPEEAIEGMTRAHVNRAGAMEGRTYGEEQAAAAKARRPQQGADEPEGDVEVEALATSFEHADPELPEWSELPDRPERPEPAMPELPTSELPTLPLPMPDLPEAAPDLDLPELDLPSLELPERGPKPPPESPGRR